MKMHYGITKTALVALGMLHTTTASAAVPIVELSEPGVLGLAAAGLLAIAWTRKRRK